MLRRLIYPGRPDADDPRVQASALIRSFAPELVTPDGGGGYDDPRSDALKLHLRGKVQPSPETTWEYGEHLRHLGIPWCSGLWMLWATGRHSDVVGTVVTWLRDRSATTFELVDNVWHALALASRLPSPTGLDQQRDFLKRHIGNAVLTPETYETLWTWASDMVRQAEWPSVSRSYHAYLEREIAKTPWLGLVPLATEMQAAFDRWLTAGRSVSLARPLDRLAQATLAVAESDLLLADRETAILALMAQWLTGIEEQTEEPLYTRPLSSLYDAPYHSEFEGPAPPLPFLELLD